MPFPHFATLNLARLPHPGAYDQPSEDEVRANSIEAAERGF
jgi:hypothetical protein